LFNNPTTYNEPSQILSQSNSSDDVGSSSNSDIVDSGSDGFQNFESALYGNPEISTNNDGLQSFASSTSLYGNPEGIDDPPSINPYAAVESIINSDESSSQSDDDDDDDDGGDFVRSLSLLSKMAQTKEEKSQQWNLKFQQTIDRLSASANAPLREKIIANVELLHLAQDFIGAAKTYGRIIISEVYLNESEKTIKPVNVGGQAGGEKYIVHGANSASVLL